MHLQQVSSLLLLLLFYFYFCGDGCTLLIGTMRLIVRLALIYYYYYFRGLAASAFVQTYALFTFNTGNQLSLLRLKRILKISFCFIWTSFWGLTLFYNLIVGASLILELVRGFKLYVVSFCRLFFFLFQVCCLLNDILFISTTWNVSMWLYNVGTLSIYVSVCQTLVF